MLKTVLFKGLDLIRYSVMHVEKCLKTCNKDGFKKKIVFYKFLHIGFTHLLFVPRYLFVAIVNGNILGLHIVIEYSWCLGIPSIFIC